MGAWPDWLNVIQLKARYLFGLWVLGALILFMPDFLAQRLHVITIRTEYGRWIGVGTLGCFAFWLVALLPLFEKQLTRRKRLGYLVNALAALSVRENALLAYCVSRRRHTVLLPDGSLEGNIAAGLCQKGLMVMAGGKVNMFAVPYTIPDEVWGIILSNEQRWLPRDDRERTAMDTYFAEVDTFADGQEGVIP